MPSLRLREMGRHPVKTAHLDQGVAKGCAVGAKMEQLVVLAVGQPVPRGCKSSVLAWCWGKHCHGCMLANPVAVGGPVCALFGCHDRRIRFVASLPIAIACGGA